MQREELESDAYQLVMRINFMNNRCSFSRAVSLSSFQSELHLSKVDTLHGFKTLHLGESSTGGQEVCKNIYTLWIHRDKLFRLAGERVNIWMMRKAMAAKLHFWGLSQMDRETALEAINATQSIWFLGDDIEQDTEW